MFVFAVIAILFLGLAGVFAFNHFSQPVVVNAQVAEAKQVAQKVRKYPDRAARRHELANRWNKPGVERGIEYTRKNRPVSANQKRARRQKLANQTPVVFSFQTQSRYVREGI